MEGSFLQRKWSPQIQGRFPGPPSKNTAAKRLRMRQVEHFRSLFQSHFPIKVFRALGFILCTACGAVVLLYATRVFDYFVVIEFAFMDKQGTVH